MKPPQGLALIKFPDGFDPEMAYQLRERDYLNLEDMQGGAVSVKANLIAKRAGMKTEKRVSYREDTTSSTSDPSISNLTKTMEKMMERLNMFERTQSRENQVAYQKKNQNQNQNFRRNQPQNRPRDSD